MAETLYADGSVTAFVSDPANAHGAPDGTFTTDTGNTNWTHRWTIENPVGTIDGAAQVQIVVRVRKDSAGGNNPDITAIDLYDGATLVGSDSTGWSITTSGTGEDVTVNITPSPSIGTNGDNLRVEIATTGAGGPPSSRRAVQVDSISVTVQNVSSDRTAQLSWAELEVPSAPRKARVAWAELEVPTPRTFPIVQQTTAGQDDSTSQLTVTFPQTATAGNLLALTVFSRGNSTNDDPTGWTQAVEVQDVANGDWLHIYYKVSDGTETSVTTGVIGAANDATQAVFVEYAGFTGTPTLDVTASSGPSTGTTISSGTTGTLADATSLAIAAFSGRTFGNTTANWTAFSNSFTELAQRGDNTSTTSLYSLHGAADYETTATTAVETTATASDSGNLMGGIAVFYDLATTRAAQISWAELEVPSAPRAAQIAWAELELPDGARTAQIAWAELEIPTAPRRARIAWAEMEIGNAPRRAQLSWAEFETPEPPKRARISWAELELPDGARAAQVSWAELEIPTAPRRARISWAEFETTNPPRRARVSWTELEFGDAPRTAQLAWAELEIPTAPRRAQIAWTELELPTAPRRARLAWTELETPSVTRAVRLTWAEFETPSAPRAARLAWAEMEINDAPRNARVSWAELELPDGARAAQVAWAELELPDAPRRSRLAWAELELPSAPRRARISWAELETPNQPNRRARLVWTEMQLPDAPGGTPRSGSTRLMLRGHS